MNSLVSVHMPATYFAEYQALRRQLIDTLSDKDLAFSLGGTTQTIGALCREMGEVEQCYVDSFRTFRQSFDYRHPDPAAVEGSVAALRSWYAGLDTAFQAAVEAVAEEDITAGRRIDRGSFSLSPDAQLDVYREALLIFYAKISVYLRAQGRPLPGDWEDWIA